MPASLAPASEGHWTDVRQDAIVLGLLLECADDFVSGGVLCDKLDVPRADQVNAALQPLETGRTTLGIQCDDLAVEDERRPHSRAG